MKKCSKCRVEKDESEFRVTKKGISDICLKCHAEKEREYKQKYILNNKEKIKNRRKEIRDSDPDRFKKYAEKVRSKEGYKSYDKEYYNKNKEKLVEKRKEYRTINPEKYKGYDKKARINGKEKSKIKTREWRIKNSESINDKRKIWRKNNPDKVRAEKKRTTEKLGDYYIKCQLKKLGYPISVINEKPELIELERIIIKTKRLCKTSKNLEMT